MADPAPQRDATLAALERLLAWPEIARSPQLAKFLDYIVRRTLDGDEQSIKAYSIAVDVLGRPPDFDPQADPIVRVQARRLRSLLDEYYRGPGSSEVTRIGLPVGRYVPEFTICEEPSQFVPAAWVPAPAPPTSSRRGGGVTVSWFVLSVIVLGIATAGYALNTWGPRQENAAAATGAVRPPSVTVVEFQSLAGPQSGGPAVSGLAIELVTDLEQFEDIEVRYGGSGDGSVAPTDLPASDYVLTGIVRPDGLVVQYSAILTDSVTATVVWNHTIAIESVAATQPIVLDEVSRLLSLVLGSPRGPLHAVARSVLVATPLEEGVNLYLCRMLFYLYRETGAAAEAERVGACLSALPETDRQSSIGLAILASLTAEYASPAVSTSASATDRSRIAQTSLERAIGLSPISGFVWEQRARLHEGMGQFRQARMDYGSSIQLNPANADALAAYARLLAFGGNLVEAEDMARSAAQDTPSPPPWYFGVPALLALRGGNYAEAIEYAELYAQADRELGPILAIMAGQRAGDGAVVNRYLPQVLDVASFRARGVLTTLRDRVQDDALMEQIRSGLVAAGVPPNALINAY